MKRLYFESWSVLEYPGFAQKGRTGQSGIATLHPQKGQMDSMGALLTHRKAEHSKATP
jgi:hypothetical protein